MFIVLMVEQYTGSCLAIILIKQCQVYSVRLLLNKVIIHKCMLWQTWIAMDYSQGNEKEVSACLEAALLCSAARCHL